MKIQELFSLRDKTVIVTGASKGLGLMMSEGLAEAGARLVMCARKLELCEQAAAEIRSLGAEVLALRCDVTDPVEVNSLVENTVAKFGRIDVLVNNAGATWEEPLEKIPLAKWNQNLAININGTFLCTQAAGRKMIEQGGGKIINIASVAGMASVDPELADCLPYSTSKGAVVAFTRDLARKWSKYHINVNAIAPGYFATKMSKFIIEHRREQVMNAIPMKRLGTKDEIKGVVVFLASAAADYITGHILAVDGGALA